MVNHPSGTTALARPDLGLAQRREAEASAALLERLMWPLDARSPEECALRALEFAIDESRQLRGMLGAFDPMGRLSVLASCDRGIRDGRPAVEVCVPQNVLERVRAASGPFVDGEWLVVPVGPQPTALLVLGGGPQDGPTGPGPLRLARALGDLVQNRLSAVTTLHNLEQEIHRLRFLRDPAHATIHSSIRLSPLLPSLKEAGSHFRPVLIVGEDGTEKEDLAHYLHAQGVTGSGPFLPFYPAVLQAHRIEAELFGTSENDGALQRASGGTLYIEGPGHMPVQVQTRLLGALVDGSYERGDEVLPLRLRVVASVPDPNVRSSGLLGELVRALADTQIHVPPLRGHCEDISSLSELVLSEMGPGPGGRPRKLTPTARRRLLDYRWGGNLRELRSVLEGAAARSGDQPITERHLPDELRRSEGTEETGLARLADVERQHIQRVLHAVGGRRANAAKVLGIATSTLYEKLKRFGLEG